MITLNKLNLRNILILISPIFINACSGSLDYKESIAFESTYAPDLSVTTLITNAKIIDGTGADTFNGSICIDQGKIKKI